MTYTAPVPPVLTLPNAISLSRVGLALGFVAAEGTTVRLALIAVASLTDFLDGWLARRQRVTSRFGALLDPVADRLFMLSVIVTYVADGALAPWEGVALFFRDVMSVIGWFVARSVSWLRPITFRARPVGKAVTVGQLLTVVAVLAAPGWVRPLVLLVGALGVVATADYTLMLWRERAR
jgi:phosphatidylglycerophosphate synthase